jgi:hypothetical protein
MAGDDGCLQTRDPPIQRLQLREQSAECLAGQRRQVCGILFDEQRSELADTPDTLRRNNAEFGKKVRAPDSPASFVAVPGGHVTGAASALIAAPRLSTVRTACWGRDTTSQIASASAASVLPRLT